jgi:hypothetical protein
MRAKVAAASPEMDLTRYRKQFAEYNRTRRLERFKGQSLPMLEEVEDRYSDLWSKSTIESLRATLKESNPNFETERDGTRRLIATAENSFVQYNTRLVRREISQNLQKLEIAKLEEGMRNEPVYSARQTLEKRWRDQLGRISDLYEELSEKENERAAELGFSSYLNLLSNGSEINIELLQSEAEMVLERTSRSYRDALRSMTTRELPGVSFEDLSISDQFFLWRHLGSDAYFAADFQKLYKQILDGLHLSVEENIHIKVTSNRYSRCFPINPPFDVRLGVGVEAGTYSTFRFLQEAGAAQYYGRNSKSLARNYPEFLFSEDLSIPLCYSTLFSLLMTDNSWLGTYRYLSPERAERVRRDVTVIDIFGIREACATLLSSMYREATGFSSIDILRGAEGIMLAARRLRAWAFEANLNEYLRIKYGRRWWLSPKARDTLVDLWNSASRFKAEEIAKLSGVGELNYDFLSEQMVSRLGKGD